MRLSIHAIGRMKQGPERELVAPLSRTRRGHRQPLALIGFDVAELPESRAGSAQPARPKKPRPGRQSCRRRVSSRSTSTARPRLRRLRQPHRPLARRRQAGRRLSSSAAPTGSTPPLSQGRPALVLLAADLAAPAGPHHAGRTAVPGDHDSLRPPLSSRRLTLRPIVAARPAASPSFQAKERRALRLALLWFVAVIREQ